MGKVSLRKLAGSYHSLPIIISPLRRVELLIDTLYATTCGRNIQAYFMLVNSPIVLITFINIRSLVRSRVVKDFAEYRGRDRALLPHDQSTSPTITLGAFRKSESM
jgi:hypothetical protein